VHSFNGVGRVDGRANVIRVFEVSRQRRPLAAPGLDDHGVLVAPLGFQVVQCGFSSVECSGAINTLKVGHEGFLVFRSHILHGVADLVDDAVLNLRVGVHAFDGLWEAFEAVNASDQNVLDAAVVQISENAEPVMGTFLVGQIQTE